MVIASASLGVAPNVLDTVTDNQRGNQVTARRFRRLPVYHERRGQVVGVLNVYDYLTERGAGSGPPAVASLMLPAIVLAAHLPVGTALVRLQRAKRSMAVVIGPDGDAIGIVTMKDLVEQIVGELEQW